MRGGSELGYAPLPCDMANPNAAPDAWVDMPGVGNESCVKYNFQGAEDGVDSSSMVDKLLSQLDGVVKNSKGNWVLDIDKAGTGKQAGRTDAEADAAMRDLMGPDKWATYQAALARDAAARVNTGSVQEYTGTVSSSRTVQ
jgi:hypothetical protein